MGQGKGLENIGPEILHQALSRNGFHHKLGQGETVVAVHAVCSRVRLEPLGGKTFQQLGGSLVAVVVKQKGASHGRTHQAGRVIQKHPHRNILVTGVCHFELRQICGHWLVKLQFPRVRKLHNRRRGVHLADGPDAVGASGRPAGMGRLRGFLRTTFDNLPVLPHCPADARGLPVGQRGLRSLLRRIGKVLCSLRRRRHADMQAEGQCQRQNCQAFPDCFSLFHM